MITYQPKYLDGEIVRVGDRVIIFSGGKKRLATITEILLPNTGTAVDCGVSNGGFCTSFDDGDCWYWSKTDEDIEFIARGCDYAKDVLNLKTEAPKI